MHACRWSRVGRTQFLRCWSCCRLILRSPASTCTRTHSAARCVSPTLAMYPSLPGSGCWHLSEHFLAISVIPYVSLLLASMLQAIYFIAYFNFELVGSSCRVPNRSPLIAMAGIMRFKPLASLVVALPHLVSEAFLSWRSHVLDCLLALLILS